MRFSLLLLVLTSLFAGEINEEFAKKYLSNVKTYQKELNQSQIIEKLKNSTSSFKIKTDKNTSVKLKLLNSNEAKKEANEVNKYLHSKTYEENIENMKGYILHDKELNYKKYVYSNLAKSVFKNLNPNKYLSKDEKVYVIISSSIPKTTLKNYIRSVQNINGEDVVFVLRGFVGGIKKVKPTLAFIQSLLKKENCNDNNSTKCMYRAKIEINPKITRHFNIQEVPAVIFVRGYNGILDKHTTFKEYQSDSEEAFIALGDSNLIYALEKLNKKAKDKTLNNLIKALRSSFFNE